MTQHPDDTYFDGYKQGESDTREELEPWIKELQEEITTLKTEVDNYQRVIQNSVNGLTDALYDLRDVL